MAIERNSKNLHEISVTFLVEVDPEYGPIDYILDAYDVLTQQEYVHGMLIGSSKPIDFETARLIYEPVVGGEGIPCSTACDVNAGCECHGGSEE